MNELEFGHQIKKQLDEALDLGPATLNRLKSARAQALAAQRLTQPAFALAWADAAMGRLSGNRASVSVAMGAGALILALAGIQYWQHTPTVEEIADIDTALLSGDLPINAYLDNSFDTWLKRSQL